MDAPVTATSATAALGDLIAQKLERRNAVSRALFDREARRLADACKEMAGRFGRGGRLLAAGRGCYATDAQHVAVEFVHPVIVGKRALPALDVSTCSGEAIAALAGPEDIVMGFGPPGGDADVQTALRAARARGAQTFALTGRGASYALDPFDADPFVHQELIEVLYHTLWETVHVFLEHREAGHDVGASAFLYPFLGQTAQDTTQLTREVADSIAAKAREDERLRARMAAERSGDIAAVAHAIAARLRNGGCLLAFGNGGSATDANDLAFDCVAPAPLAPSIRAISLSSDPAVISALANDIGAGSIFLRQLLACGRPHDVAVAISTSGGSDNVIAGLAQARKMGMFTLALLGRDGGEIARLGLADAAIVVPSTDIPRIQEVQASIYHVLIDLLRMLVAE